MRCSSIDIGTNSIRHLICDINDKNLYVVKKDVKITRLGDGVSKTGKLSNDAISRSIGVVKDFIKDSKRYNILDDYVFATSAVRDAKNSSIFLDELKMSNIDLDVIDGKTESLFGYLGASYGIDKKDILVIDIGGGSTELSYKSRNDIVKESFNIGALRLTEKFIKNDPPTPEECNNMRLHIIDTLVSFINDDVSLPKDIVGIGGTITSLAAISLNLEKYDKELVHGYVLDKSEIKKLLDRLISVKLEERKLINGLQPERADIIVAGAIILLTIIELLNCDSIIVSEWDNLEGSVVSKYIIK